LLLVNVCLVHAVLLPRYHLALDNSWKMVPTCS